jgi:1,4-alpha-glucan branching enzyme
VLLTDHDIYHFREGTFFRAYEKLGAHPLPATAAGAAGGTHFAVWAPNADAVSVVGDFNGWKRGRDRLTPRSDASGIWEGVVSGVGPGALYKYHIASRQAGFTADKSDPYAFRAEVPPRTASVVWDLGYEWHDGEWMRQRAAANALGSPWSIYELHPGSWRRLPAEHNRFLSYRELAHAVGEYVTELGFTHVELLPVMEHPFYGSWGYQVTGYFAPTARYGTPQDFMYLVDHLHQRGIGVILDWVPSHFPTDGHGLARFDGTHLYEHADPRQGFHRDWNTLIYNYGRREVSNFLLSNALYWLREFHIDGIRVDAVASMLYLDYSRPEGEWIPNAYGGRENLEAIAFLRRVNELIFGEVEGATSIAEESTAWPMVSRPTYVGGLGFGYKWNLGWMHDTLRYMSTDPIYRKFHHNDLSFGLLYAFHENFILALSHDEVVHGKGSLIGRMPGDTWQRFANLRAYYGFMWTHPGKKLLFMGCEFAQDWEWNHDIGLDWQALDHPLHEGVKRLVSDLNQFYRSTPALHRLDADPDGFQWVDVANAEQSVISFLRRGRGPHELALVVCNFTPVPREGYLIGVPRAGRWRERINTDAVDYGGSGVGNAGEVHAEPHPIHGHAYAVRLRVPPLATLIFTAD